MAACGTVSSAPVILRVVSNAVEIVNRAGKIIKDVMSAGNLGIVEKGLNDLQTEADRSAQRCIVSSLARQFPKLTIIGEETLKEKRVQDDWLVSGHNTAVLAATLPEHLQSVTEEDIVVWVDPLDGTKEYTQGFLDHVTILVGIAVRGKAVGGVIHQPYYNYQVEKDVLKQGRTMWAIVGVGAFGIRTSAPPEHERIVTVTRSHANSMLNRCLQAMAPDQVLRVGGAGHKVILLMEGKAHAYVFPSNGCKKWDTCAPEALLCATGGLLTDIRGNRLQYDKDVEHPNSAGILATAVESQHAWYLSRVPQDVRDQFPQH